MRFWLLALLLACAAPAGAQIPVPQIPQSGPILPPDAGQPAAPSTPPRAAPPAAPAAPPARPAAVQQPTDPALARQPIEALEANILGACPQGDLALTRVSGGEAPVRLSVERQMAERGIRSYRYVYRATGCGRAARRHNVEVLARENLPPLAIALPMGTTVTTANVLNGVFDSLFTPMMRERHPACEPRRLKIREANLTTGEPYTRGGEWTETWVYDACGAAGEAQIIFSYDGEGLQMRGQITQTP